MVPRSLFLAEIAISSIIDVRREREHPTICPDRIFSGGLHFTALHGTLLRGTRDHHCRRSRPSVCHAGYRSPIPEGDGKNREADLRLVGEFLSATSKWRTLRYVLFGQS